MIRFYYQQETSSLGPVMRPVADVRLKNKDFAVEIPMYIDSGADISVIPLRFGRALGLAKEPGDETRRLKGIEGRGVPYIIKKLELQLDNQAHNIRIAWAQTEEVPMLMGRMDVFNRYRITFDEGNGWVDFETKQQGDYHPSGAVRSAS